MNAARFVSLDARAGDIYLDRDRAATDVVAVVRAALGSPIVAVVETVETPSSVPPSRAPSSTFATPESSHDATAPP